MPLAAEPIVEETAVLSKALLSAGKSLGMTQSQIGRAVGRDRTSLPRGIESTSKAGELALLLIRCYRSLYVLVGGKDADLAHWMSTENYHTAGIPIEQVQNVTGLVQVVEYLDAMRSKN